MVSMCKASFLSLVLFVSLVIEQTWAAQHVVGGSQGWDESADFNSWASGQTFKVGDQLVFKYSSGLHSVVELGSESAYKKCDLGTALDSMSTGKDVVKLNKVGTRYFACGTMGHCDQGMKLKITTVSGSAPASPASPSSPASTSAAAPAAFVSMVLEVVALSATTLFCLIML